MSYKTITLSLNNHPSAYVLGEDEKPDKKIKSKKKPVKKKK